MGDMGEKVGLQGLDNGFMLFNNYELDVDNLLDKTGSITPEGKYVSPIKDSKKRFCMNYFTMTTYFIVLKLCK